MIAGDFNEILHKDERYEKWGGKSFEPRKADLCLDVRHWFCWSTFTWTNRRKGFALIKGMFV